TRIYPSKLLNRKESINMFSENLKAMRKAKGYTQEELAIKLNVTRQTISKWEKGLSVPDVDFLFKIADVLETNVGTLLGGAIMDEVNKDTVAEQLAKISEQLAIKNRRSKRIWKIVGIVLLTILALNLLLAIFGMSAYTSFSTDGKTTVIEMNEDSVSYEE
ncbi:helix-turn-helix domain-containing protein, partial [Ruminococcus sp.]